VADAVLFSPATKDAVMHTNATLCTKIRTRGHLKCEVENDRGIFVVLKSSEI